MGCVIITLRIMDKEKKKYNQDNIFLGLDIGTEFVKAVIANKKKDGSLEIIGVGKAHQGMGNMYAGQIFHGTHGCAHATQSISCIQLLYAMARQVNTRVARKRNKRCLLRDGRRVRRGH